MTSLIKALVSAYAPDARFRVAPTMLEAGGAVQRRLFLRLVNPARFDRVAAEPTSLTKSIAAKRQIA